VPSAACLCSSLSWLTLLPAAVGISAALYMQLARSIGSMNLRLWQANSNKAARTQRALGGTATPVNRPLSSHAHAYAAGGAFARLLGMAAGNPLPLPPPPILSSLCTHVFVHTHTYSFFVPPLLTLVLFFFLHYLLAILSFSLSYPLELDVGILLDTAARLPTLLAAGMTASPLGW